MENIVEYIAYELLSANYTSNSTSIEASKGRYEYSVTPSDEIIVSESGGESFNTLHVRFSSSLEGLCEDVNKTPRFSFESEIDVAFKIDKNCSDIQKLIDDSHLVLAKKGVEISHEVMLGLIKQTRFSAIQIPMPTPTE